jgi:NAD(P)-dependent dehydrogenase (short-subunit alcohol dehydrogenase family)
MFGWGLKDRSPELTRQAWKDSIDVMLTGAFNTVHVALPAMIEGGNGGSIVLTSSTAGLKTMVGPSATAEAAATGIGYAAAKNGLAGLMKVWAGAMGHHGIRVNSVLPTGVNTPFLVNDVMQQAMLDNPGMAASWRNALPVELIEAVDISNAIAWLCSDAARYVTGVQLPVDAGFLIL